MKNNKKEILKKEKEEKKDEYVESTPRFKMGDKVLFFTDASIKVEKGEIMGIFSMPTSRDKNYAYQIEHEYTDDKKKVKKGMCIPKSENIFAPEDTDKAEKKYIKHAVAILDGRIDENKESLKMLKEQMKTDVDFEKEVHKILENLNKRKAELLGKK